MSEISFEEKLNSVQAIIKEYNNRTVLISSIAEKCSGLLTSEEVELLTTLSNESKSAAESYDKNLKILIKNANVSI